MCEDRGKQRTPQTPLRRPTYTRRAYGQDMLAQVETLTKTRADFNTNLVASILMTISGAVLEGTEPELARYVGEWRKSRYAKEKEK